MREAHPTDRIPSTDGKLLLDKQDESLAGIPPTSQPNPPTGTWKRRIAVVGALIAAIALFGCGILAGIASVDPTTSEQFLTMRDSRDSQIEENDVLRQAKESATTELEELKSGLESREAEIASAEQAIEEREAAVGEAEQAVQEREEAVAGAEEEKAQNTVSNGTWTVGIDLAPGTYRSDEPVSEDCYWGIYRTGTNGSDIIENDIPGGGRPTVTLSKGQDFNSSRCGTWSKQ